eukprot:c13278_g1_i1.p1 GENE.c13278_g1_i1~~c13278_g1_i1.p1  ORF type:complete len:231 (-),score=57.31 c13278_g1_i1:48-701(-)
MSVNKRQLFSVTLFISIVALVCAVAAACGLAKQSSDIKRVPWCTSHGEGLLGTTPVDIYYGVQAVVIDVTVAGKTSETKYTWDNVDCTSGNCGTCKDASQAIFATTIIGIVFILLSLGNQVNRGFGGDGMFFKVAGIVISLTATVAFASSLIAFGKCYDNLATDYEVVTLSKKLSTGFALMLVACVLELVVTVVHCFVRAPASSSGSTLTQRLTGRT